ncbi:hypothetical protein HG537_0A00260 [Torulaspora globosa]|uniref:Protein GLC8 n=1 Tax=Torulaspora globosa TaxID=48254 RepID=A0A7H9HKC2_9SACH|nr:hypothetical protein HG537_0A00260 [Torulaspora sp. CBS 2947]
MGGILKNPLPANQAVSDNEESISEFRKQVLMNTKLNAKLTSKKREGLAGAGGSHVLPKDTLSLKHQQDAEERLQWNQKNLAANELTKQQYQDIHIDEPKTPYQGAIDPDGEYYKDDDEDEAELQNFSLDPGSEPVLEPKAENTSSEPAADPESDKDERSRRFEEMRKKHYNLKEALQNRRLQDNDDDDDDDENDEDEDDEAENKR